MATMKAIQFQQFGGPEVLEYVDVPRPQPGPGEVLVKVHAVSVNRTLDLVMRAGRYAKPVKLPHILGVDPSGVIAEVGDGVTDRKVGDRVVTVPWRSAPTAPSDSVGVQRPGGYAEYVALPAIGTLPIPGDLDFVTATVVARHAAAAFTLLRDAAAVKAGEWVLIMGASGGLGSAGVQVAKAMGANVIAGAGADERVKAAVDLGADAGVNYRTQDLTAEVMKITDGKGVNVVFENVGDPDLFPKAFASLGRFGRLVTSGGHAGGLVQIDINKLYLNQISIHGRVGFSQKDIVDSLQAAADGKFKIIVDAVLPLKDAAEAHRRVDARNGLGKVVLDPTKS